MSDQSKLSVSFFASHHLMPSAAAAKAGTGELIDSFLRQGLLELLASFNL